MVFDSKPWFDLEVEVGKVPFQTSAVVAYRQEREGVEPPAVFAVTKFASHGEILKLDALLELVLKMLMNPVTFAHLAELKKVVVVGPKQMLHQQVECHSWDAFVEVEEMVQRALFPVTVEVQLLTLAYCYSWQEGIGVHL